MNFATKQISDIEIQPGFKPGSSEFKRQLMDLANDPY